MASTLSVVAGLLATMTVAGAFQVPGSYGDKGVPVLLPKLAFKVFMISNTFAMCGLMVVLFSLFWVMLAGSAIYDFVLTLGFGHHHIPVILCYNSFFFL